MTEIPSLEQMCGFIQEKLDILGFIFFCGMGTNQDGAYEFPLLLSINYPRGGCTYKQTLKLIFFKDLRKFALTPSDCFLSVSNEYGNELIKRLNKEFDIRYGV